MKKFVIIYKDGMVISVDVDVEKLKIQHWLFMECQ